MKLDRTGALAVGLIAIAAIGLGAAFLWPSSKPALDCPPDDVRFVDAGAGLASIAVCQPNAPKSGVTTAQAVAVGAKVDLNHVTEPELAQVPGVGPALARTLIEERDRRGGFKTWDEVDAVKGVGPSKLEVLQQALDLRP